MCLIINRDPSTGLHTLMAYVSPFKNPIKMNGILFSRMVCHVCLY